MKPLYGSCNAEITKRELENIALAREAAREGMVLLKNDGVLPLAAQKIALYGMGARKTVKGGTGSGAVQERHSVNIEEGLENAGYIITTKNYLDDYDRQYVEDYEAWHDSVEQSIIGMDPMKAYSKAGENPFRYPSGRIISEKDIADSDTDTAIYVVMRQAGEGNDRRLEQGDFYLTDTETANIRKVADGYKNTIVIINIGGLCDLSFMDEIDGIGALVFFAQGGMEGGNALADLLSGKHSFSGKLTDSWPMKYEDIPNSENFSHLNGNLQDEYYTEGIYVGYRYFDSFGVAPRYPFGFGLSYTGFSIKVDKVELRNTRVTAEVTVCNNGTRDGKEVVQAYLSCPEGKLKKEYQRLVGFAKTAELTPGSEQTVVISFDLSEASSYNETQAAWMLESGNYLLNIGNSSISTSIAAVFSLPVNIITEQCRVFWSASVEEVTPPPAIEWDIPESVVRISVDPCAFVTKQYDYCVPEIAETEQEQTLLNSLTLAEMVDLVIGGDLRSSDPSNHVVLGAGGKTAITLKEKGIGNIVVSDGPAGLNIVEHIKIDANGKQWATYIPEKYNFGNFATMVGASIAREGADVYRYATAWPVELLLAQTWNLPLIERVGDGVGQEMDEFGITLWLAPGMNIHRNPLCGRNFEYFSEDPFLSGKMAAAITKGVQSHKGAGVTIKHFACNNQEDNRNGVSSNVNERALREIYLKGFEIAVRESQPMSVMSSYNRLNGVYTANSRDLLTSVLRCEWGFVGMVMTDWYSCVDGLGKPELCLTAGNDLIMPDTPAQPIIEALEHGAIDKTVLRRSACRVLRVVLNFREEV